MICMSMFVYAGLWWFKSFFFLFRQNSSEIYLFLTLPASHQGQTITLSGGFHWRTVCQCDLLATITGACKRRSDVLATLIRQVGRVEKSVTFIFSRVAVPIACECSRLYSHATVPILWTKRSQHKNWRKTKYICSTLTDNKLLNPWRTFSFFKIFFTAQTSPSSRE